MKFFTTFAVFASLCAVKVSAEVRVYTTHLIAQNLIDYQEALDGRDPLEIEDIATAMPSRLTLEPFIMQVAPVLGGCNCRIEYLPHHQYTSHARSIEQVRNGHEIAHGIAGFGGDTRYEHDISLSSPILAPEDFFVGLYTHEDREDVLSSFSDEDIKSLNFAVGTNWLIDNQLIDSRGFNKRSADNWDSLVSMIITGRADVIMQPFTQEDDLSMLDTMSGETFLPIPNIKLRFQQGRYYTVSEKHPDGPAFLEALNRGLKILEEQGTLRKAMVHAGVINENAEDFRIIGSVGE